MFCLLLATPWAAAQETWFQIEVSVFSNEVPADRNEEVWTAAGLALDYPPRLRRLDTLLSRLLIPAFTEPAGVEPLAAENLSAPESLLTPEPDPVAERLDAIRATGPFPPRPGEPYAFIDFARDAFVQLPMTDSDFRQTNSALERNPRYRLLFHGLWRQPMPMRDGATALFVSGGERYDEHYELEGSLRFHYNNGRDRIVADADLWLSEFSVTPDTEQDWRLPELPELSGLRAAAVGTPEAAQMRRYFPVTIYHLAQQREMRSTEFHYLDHPALGVIVTVTPYEVPPFPEANADEETLPPQ